MRRIEVMAKMDEQNVANEIVTFLREHELSEKVGSIMQVDVLDVIYGLAQYLGEEVAE